MRASISLIFLNKIECERYINKNIFIEEAIMKLCKMTLVFAVCFMLINILTGAGWCNQKEIWIEPYHNNGFQKIFHPAIAVDNSGIHCGSKNGNAAECDVAMYFRSLDDGSNWTSQGFGKNPYQTFTTLRWTYIIANTPYINFFTQDCGDDPVAMNSRNGGTNWTSWQDMASGLFIYDILNNTTSPLITVCAKDSQQYLFWSDQTLIQDNPEIFFMKSADGGNTWYCYDSISSNPQRITFADGNSIFPDAAANGNKIHLVWSDNRDDSYNYEIYYKYSYDGGQSWYPEDDERLTYEADSSLFPAIVTYDTSLHIVFQDKREGIYQIFYKRSLNNGLTWNEDEYAITDGINPDIAADQYGLHVVYEYGDEIYYLRSSNFGATWSTPENISQDTFHSCAPRIYTDYRGRHIVWYNKQKKLRYRQFDILPPSAPRNFRIKYISEYGTQNWVEICFDWDENTAPDLAGYDMYRRPWAGDWEKINDQLINENCYFDTVPSNEVYVYYIVALDDTDNISEPSDFAVYYPPDYKSDIGKSEPSVYLIERDSFIQWENNSAKTADVDNSQLIYRFQNLNPNMIYELGIVYYQGDNEERTQILKVNNIEVQEITVPTTPQIYVYRIPASIYANGDMYANIEKLSGPNVIVSEIYLWKIYSGGGSQSSGKNDFKRYDFSLIPNITKNRTIISYTLPSQSKISLKIYDSAGILIRTLVNQMSKKGFYQYEWNSTDDRRKQVPSGIYIIQLSIDNNITSKRLLLIR